jgi:hypothetical protein
VIRYATPMSNVRTSHQGVARRSPLSYSYIIHTHTAYAYRTGHLCLRFAICELLLRRMLASFNFLHPCRVCVRVRSVWAVAWHKCALTRRATHCRCARVRGLRGVAWLRWQAAPVRGWMRGCVCARARVRVCMRVCKLCVKLKYTPHRHGLAARCQPSAVNGLAYAVAA